MNKVFKTILLLALPASGKSEVRNFMANMDPEILKNDFHIGENLQIDDFPYVHFMRLIDNALADMGRERLFYRSDEEPYINNKDWGTLTVLISEDYSDIMNRRVLDTESYAMSLFARLDNAAVKAGIEPRLAALPEDVIASLADLLEDEAHRIENMKEEQYPDSFEDKTVIIECARGGPDGSSMPLTGEYGYQYTLPMFSDEILKDAAILYIWVTPEESRRKNNERANPDDPGSNLFHGVPMAVMLGDYGCDDMAYLIEHSEQKDTVTVETHAAKYHVPIGVFDNRQDKTSYLRRDKSEWSDEDIAEMTAAVRNATETMWNKKH